MRGWWTLNGALRVLVNQEALLFLQERTNVVLVSEAMCACLFLLERKNKCQRGVSFYLKLAFEWNPRPDLPDGL